MDRFVDELERLRLDHARRFGGLPMEYSPELVARIVEYVREQQSLGQVVPVLSARLGIELSRLRQWVYRRPRGRGRDELFSTGGMRPVKVSAELVRVPDGVPERRFTVRLRTGLKVSDLTLREVTELLRSLV